MSSHFIMHTHCFALILLSCTSFCFSAEQLTWKEVAKQEALDFLNGHGVIARRLVVNSAGGFELDLRGASITNLNVLEGMPLEILLLSGSSVRDLAPLRTMRHLKKLDVANTEVSDITALKDLRLYDLNITKTQVRDLDAVRNMPLQILSLVRTEVRDLTPIRSLRLHEMYFSADA